MINIRKSLLRTSPSIFPDDTISYRAETIAEIAETLKIYDKGDPMIQEVLRQIGARERAIAIMEILDLLEEKGFMEAREAIKEIDWLPIPDCGQE